MIKCRESFRVVLMHAGGVTSMYGHADALAVHEGQTVAAGRVVAWVGATGNSTGPSPDFQVRLNVAPVDSSMSTYPVAFLACVGVKV
jgi:murein DD-endopeptidase MepM/ murein hydrolase activator NlpD